MTHDDPDSSADSAPDHAEEFDTPEEFDASEEFDAPPEGLTPRDPHASLRKLRPVEISRHSYERIQRKYPDHVKQTFVGEYGKSRRALTVPVHRPTKVDRGNLAYKQAGFLAASLAIAAAGFFFLPSDMLLIKLALLLPILFTGLMFYEHYGRWKYWSLVIGVTDLFIVNQPPGFPGGYVARIALTEIRHFDISNTPEDTEAGDAKSNLAGYTGLDWLTVDTISPKDKAFNWAGPFDDAPEILSTLTGAIDLAKLTDMLWKERDKNLHRPYITGEKTPDDFMREVYNPHL